MNDINFNKKVGKLLRKARLKKGFTQEGVADALGITVQAYQKYEYGTCSINIRRARDLFQTLDLKLDKLFTIRA